MYKKVAYSSISTLSVSRCALFVWFFFSPDRMHQRLHEISDLLRVSERRLWRLHRFPPENNLAVTGSRRQQLFLLLKEFRPVFAHFLSTGDLPCK